MTIIFNDGIRPGVELTTFEAVFGGSAFEFALAISGVFLLGLVAYTLLWVGFGLAYEVQQFLQKRLC